MFYIFLIIILIIILSALFEFRIKYQEKKTIIKMLEVIKENLDKKKGN
jgi:hypothetical protein